MLNYQRVAGRALHVSSSQLHSRAGLPSFLSLLQAWGGGKLIICSSEVSVKKFKGFFASKCDGSSQKQWSLKCGVVSKVFQKHQKRGCSPVNVFPSGMKNPP